MRKKEGFVKTLMEITVASTIQLEMRIAAVCCLNDDVKFCYKTNEQGESIHESDKAFLKGNIIDCISYNLQHKSI